MQLTRPVFILLCLFCTKANADPSFDCGKADGSVEELICAHADLAALDQRMSRTYQNALKAAEALDAGAEDAAAELRAMQRGWIKGRNDCWKADDLKSCVESAYLDREGALVAAWLLQPAVAIVSYTCEDNPANEVTAFFFDTQKPSIRVEYGDGIKTGTLQPAASGSNYSLAFGGSFWSKGSEAIFEWVEGEAQSCRDIR